MPFIGLLTQAKSRVFAARFGCIFSSHERTSAFASVSVPSCLQGVGAGCVLPTEFCVGFTVEEKNLYLRAPASKAADFQMLTSEYFKLYHHHFPFCQALAGSAGTSVVLVWPFAC